MCKKLAALLVFSCIFIRLTGWAQIQPLPPRIEDFNFHSWFTYNGDHKFSKKFGLHFDTQIRRADGIQTWQQYQLRPGLNWHFSEDAMFTLGYVYTDTFPYGDQPMQRFPEHRIYQQLQVRDNISWVRLIHRYRLEQRWLGRITPVGVEPLPAHWQLRNRFRYRLGAEIPLERRVLDGGRTYLALFDEIIVGFGQNLGGALFDQNRAYAALGIRVRDGVRVETGFMNQLLHWQGGRVLQYNNTVMLQIFSDLPFGR